MSEWIAWKGGECPVDLSSNVEIKLRLNDGSVRKRDGDDTAAWFDHLEWWHGSPNGIVIIAYRVVSK